MGDMNKDANVLGVDMPAVTRWFEENVPGVKPTLTFDAISGGMSNLTYKVSDAGGNRYVLRRPPVGKLQKGAHDVRREYRIMTALKDTAVPVPGMAGFCADHSVTGADFYVMYFVDGVVMFNPESAEKALNEAGRLNAANQLIDTLVTLQSVDPDSVGLADLGKKDGYILRQIKNWARQVESVDTNAKWPLMGELSGRLSATVPEQKETALVHGDYRLENVICDSAGNIVAVLDWEVCTRGDPMNDISYILATWPRPNEPFPTRVGPSLASGFPDKQDLLVRYAEKSGRDLSGIQWYLAYHYWRIAAISVRIYMRYASGAMGEGTGTDIMAEVLGMVDAYSLQADKELSEFVN